MRASLLSPTSSRLALRVLALQALVLFGRAAGQVPPSPLAPVNPAPIVYCPPERLSMGPPSAQHVLNVFLPPGLAPAGGWPVVVATGYGGAASSPPFAALRSTGSTAPLWNLVAARIAVVHFGTPGLVGGRGLWYPPGHPSGRYESFRPAHDNPEKSAEWALQWVKVQTLHPFDLTRVGLRGSSGGAVLAIRTAMGPDRARASGSAQVRASTRVKAILAIQPPTSAWALEQGPELTIPFPKHLEQLVLPGIAATQLAQVSPELQKDYSLMREAFQSAEARANNARQPICLVYADPVLRVGGQVASFALDASGFPLLHDLIKQPTQHDSWFGYVFWKRLTELSSESAAFHAANSVFAMRDIHALPAPNALHTRTFTGGALNARATSLGHAWLVAQLGGVPVSSRASLRLAPGGGRRGAAGLVTVPDASRVERLALGIEGEAGATAWLAIARDQRGGPPPGAGELQLDPRRQVGPLLPFTLAPDASGTTWVELEPGVGAELDGLVLQAWVVARERAGVRVTPTNVLSLARAP